MSVTVLFLGKLADLAGAAERDFSAPLDWAGLLAALPPELVSEVDCDEVKLAHNGALLHDRQALAAADGDEVALLPPVSGG